jgi:hypothetical protein
MYFLKRISVRDPAAETQPIDMQIRTMPWNSPRRCMRSVDSLQSSTRRALVTRLRIVVRCRLHCLPRFDSALPDRTPRRGDRVTSGLLRRPIGKRIKRRVGRSWARCCGDWQHEGGLAVRRAHHSGVAAVGVVVLLSMSDAWGGGFPWSVPGVSRNVRHRPSAESMGTYVTGAYLHGSESGTDRVVSSRLERSPGRLVSGATSNSVNT